MTMPHLEPLAPRRRPTPRPVALFWALALVAIAAACGPKPAVQRAQALLDAGDYRGAITAADEELAKTPDAAPLWRLKIRAEMLVGDSKAAIAVYQSWRARRQSDDRVALREMAELTLWRGLSTPSTELNVAAISSIEKHQLVRLADEVTALIASDDDEVAAAAAIAVLRDHPQAASVAAARLSSPNPRARATVIRGISRKILDRAGKEIREGLADSAPEVRRAAIAGVVLFRDRSDTAALARLARTDPDNSVRIRAARALARPPYFPALELAKVLLRDEFVGVKLAGLELAKASAAVGGRDLLREAVRSEDVSVAIRAAVLLGKGPSSKPLFTRALVAERWPIRAAALGAVLAATDRETATSAARAAADDGRPEVRLAAARLMVRLGDLAGARPIFEAQTLASTPSLSAALALARHYEDPRGLTAVARLAGADDRGVRAAALSAFIELDVVAPALVAALDDEAPALRMQAADVLLTVLDD